jgi:two-component system sensor histidine kinase GlrK
VTLPRPRSLSGLILLGLLVVSLPLLAGVLSAGFEMGRLSDSSERLVVYGVQATRYTQALVRQVAAMERTARLYQLLGQPQLKSLFDENHRRLGLVLDGVTARPGDAERDAVVAGIRRRADAIAEALSSGTSARRADALREFGPLATDTGRLSLLASQQIDRELRAVQAETEQARSRLLWQTAALIPLTVALALAFTYVLGRPLRDIDRAIANLGNGRLDETVSVRGPPTDLEALGRQIEWLRQRLLEVSEERELFLRHVSHELKTPLANIREGSELLLEGTVGTLRPQQQEVTNILRENSLRLQQLIENLLSYSEWKSSRGVLDTREFRLPPLVDSVVESYLLLSQARALQVVTDVEELSLHADQAKLRLVLDNLVSNAIKFTPEGGTIRIAAHRDATHVTIEVEDSGPGVPDAERGRIFEPFFQGATPQGGLVRGTGIGLSVVQEIVQAHGGSIELTEGVLSGACFRVRIPVGDTERKRTNSGLQ